MYPNNYNYPNMPPPGSGAGMYDSYPYMRPPMLQPPVAMPTVPPAFNAEYAKWAQWNSHFQMNPTENWRHQSAAAMRPTPYDRPVTIQHQVPYGGRPYVPRDLSGPNANTMRGPPVPPSLNQNTTQDNFYGNITPNLEFDVHVSSTKLDVLWKQPHVSGQVSYEMTVTEGRNMPFTLQFPTNHTRHSIRAKAGESYSISITAKKVINGVTVAHGQRTIKAIFSDAELRQLYDKAAKYTGTRMHQFQILYRCKPKPYWDDIHHNCSNVMEKYMKDDNGQPANMINGVISGLFFSARLLPNGTLPTSSPFGNVRMLVQAIMFLDPTSVNIYFADFYCNKQAHYVTVIVARKGSDSDRYSQKYLMQLDMESNPWLKVQTRPVGGELKFFFYAATSVWVEILYTENVPLNWGRFDKIAATGLGTSKIGGLSNNKSCTICNLYPPGSVRADEADEELQQLQPAYGHPGEREQWQEERMNRSISPGLVDERYEEESKDQEEEEEPVNEEECLDGVDLPAYEMGGNSTFHTLINIPNVHDCPNWTDLIECVCEVVDCTVLMDQQAREREITNFNSHCDLQIERAIEDMDSFVGSCDEDQIHDLAGEVHELHDWWKRARDELAKLAEAHENKRAAAAAAQVPPTPQQAPPPTSARSRKNSQKRCRQPTEEEEDMDEYLDDDDDVITTQSGKTAATTTTTIQTTPSAMVMPRPIFTTPATVTPKIMPALPLSPSSIPLPDTPKAWPPAVTVTPSAFAMPAKAPPTIFPSPTTVAQPSPASAPLPDSPVTVVVATPSRKERKKKERKPKIKEEELDEYLDDDEVTVEQKKTEEVSVVVTQSTVEEVKQETKGTVYDLLDDSTIDLSLFDEVGNASIMATPATIKNGTVATPVAIKNVTVATPVAVKNVTVTTPVAIKNVTVTTPVAIKNVTVTTPVAIKNVTVANPATINNGTVAAPATIKNGTVAAPVKDTVVAASASIEGEDEYEEDDEITVVDLKRSIAAPCPPTPAVETKRAKLDDDELDLVELTEEELLLAPCGSGPHTFVDITPEMEDELLRDDSL